MAVSDLLARLRGDPRFMSTVATWRTLPARPPLYAPVPARLHPALATALPGRGIERLYRHQHDAVEAALAGGSVAVVTPTASGKTLCYNLPVFETLLADPQATALYLFPTKALAQDQLKTAQRLADTLLAESAHRNGYLRQALAGEAGRILIQELGQAAAGEDQRVSAHTVAVCQPITACRRRPGQPG